MKKLMLAITCFALSNSLSAQLSGSFDACDQGTTHYPWYIGGNSLSQTQPANWSQTNPHQTWVPVPQDLGTCNSDPLILKSNNLQSVFITASGYIGINNSAPSAALDIKNPSIGQQSNFRILGDVNGNLESTSDMRFNFANGKEIMFNAGTAASNTTRMAIKSNGQVAIGNPLQSSSPYVNSALLSVKGQIISQEVIVTVNNWSDFVFEKNYKLMPLSELETFYTNNHHLPDVPTAKEITEKGDELGKTDAMLLQKIEELTLYIVELEKRLKKVEEH